jgi:hypothetical protein
LAPHTEAAYQLRFDDDDDDDDGDGDYNDDDDDLGADLVLHTKAAHQNGRLGFPPVRRSGHL